METRANYVAVGAFVLILLIGVAAMLFWLVGGRFNQAAVFYEINFNGSVSGLAKDSAVRLNGIEIGHVKDIEINPMNPRQVRVTIQTDPITIIRADAKATLQLQGLTGGSYIEIGGGTNDSPAIEHRSTPPFPVIASETSGLQKLVDSAPEVLQKLIELGDRLNTILDEKNQAALAETLENMRQVSGDIRQVSQVLARRSGDIDAAIADAAGSMKELRQTVKESDATVRKIGDTAGHADALVQENRAGLRDFSGRGLNQLQQLIAAANDLVVKVDHIADQLDRDPARFLFGGRDGGYKPK